MGIPSESAARWAADAGDTRRRANSYPSSVGYPLQGLEGWDADPVRRALVRFVKTEVEQEGLAPDLVVFSGDLADAGKAHEYALARDWLDNQLWPALPGDLTRDRLLLVPGNHDVDRNKVGTGVRSMQEGLLKAKSQEDIAALLGDDGEREIMLRRHAGYMDFVAGWYGEPQPLPWWDTYRGPWHPRARRRSRLRLDVLQR